VWSSVGPAVPFVRADLTICLKYLGMTEGCHPDSPWETTALWAPVAKLQAQI
jgi:hypothetical protein